MFIQIGRLITLRDTGRAIELKLWFLLKLESNYGNFCKQPAVVCRKVA